MTVKRSTKRNTGGKSVRFAIPSSFEGFSTGYTPLFEKADFSRSALLLGLGTIAVSFWFLTAATVRIGELPPDAFFYISQLPLIYWLGLVSTFALFALRSLVKDRAR